MAVKLSLVDNDYEICAKTDLDTSENGKGLNSFFNEMNEELITGRTAFLKIEGSEVGPITLEVSKFE